MKSMPPLRAVSESVANLSELRQLEIGVLETEEEKERKRSIAQILSRWSSNNINDQQPTTNQSNFNNSHSPVKESTFVSEVLRDDASNRNGGRMDDPTTSNDVVNYLGDEDFTMTVNKVNTFDPEIDKDDDVNDNDSDIDSDTNCANDTMDVSNNDSVSN